MGISDWSSDVCASDVVGTYPDQEKRPARHGGHAGVRGGASLGGRSRNAIPAYGKSLFECTDSGAGFGCSSQGCQGSLSRSRSEEHTSELQSLMRISYAVFCLKKKKKNANDN